MGECFFWYRPTRVVPDQRPLNGRRRCCCCCYMYQQHYSQTTHTHTRLTAFFVWDYPGKPVPEGKTNLDFTEARDSEWQWHQLGRMQVCSSLQTDNHASTSLLSFLQAGCPSCRPTNSVKAPKATTVRLSL